MKNKNNAQLRFALGLVESPYYQISILYLPTKVVLLICGPFREYKLYNQVCIRDYLQCIVVLPYIVNPIIKPSIDGFRRYYMSALLFWCFFISKSRNFLYKISGYFISLSATGLIDLCLLLVDCIFFFFFGLIVLLHSFSPTIQGFF